MPVEVRDSGTGLDAERAEHLFDAFYTTKSAASASACRSAVPSSKRTAASVCTPELRMALSSDLASSCRGRLDRSVVRERIHAPARHRGDAVEHLERHAGRLRRGDELFRHRRQRDADAARRPSRSPPASAVTVIASLSNGIGDPLERALGSTRKPGSAAMTRAEAISDAVFIDASREPTDRRLGALGELPAPPS